MQRIGADGTRENSDIVPGCACARVRAHRNEGEARSAQQKTNLEDKAKGIQTGTNKKRDPIHTQMHINIHIYIYVCI